MSRVKRQHFVPQFYLRAFSINGQEQKVHVFDKPNRKQFVSNIEQVASRRHFYDVQEVDRAAGEAQAIEKMFSKLEGDTAPLVAELIESAQTARSLELDSANQAQLAAFLAFQFLRSDEARRKIVQGRRAISTRLTDLGQLLGAKVEGAEAEGSDAQLHAESMLDLPFVNRVGACFAERAWAVLRTEVDRAQFITSDNPVVYGRCVKGHGPAGIESPEVGIAFPLAPSLLLSFQPKVVPWSDQIRVVDICDADVSYFNSLQVGFATSQLYSASDDFQFVRALLDAVPGLSDPDRNRVLINGRPPQGKA